MTCLLVRELVDNRIAEFKIFVRRYRVQVIHPDFRNDISAAALQLDGDFFIDVAVQNRCHWHELGDEIAVDPQQNISRRQAAGGRGPGYHLV